MLRVATRSKGFIDITEDLRRWLHGVSARDGLLTVFVCHTSASLTIQENADPNVLRDLMTTLEDLAPEDAHYAHAEEGPDDMPSHIKAMLTEVSLSIPVMGGRMVLGTWQGVYLIEHRTAPHERNIALSLSSGERRRADVTHGKALGGGDELMHDAGFGHGVSGSATMRKSASGQARARSTGGLRRRHHIVAAMHDHAGNVPEAVRGADQLIVGVEEAAVHEVMAFDAREGEGVMRLREAALALGIRQQRERLALPGAPGARRFELHAPDRRRSAAGDRLRSCRRARRSGIGEGNSSKASGKIQLQPRRTIRARRGGA